VLIGPQQPGVMWDNLPHWKNGTAARHYALKVIVDDKPGYGQDGRQAWTIEFYAWLDSTPVTWFYHIENTESPEEKVWYRKFYDEGGDPMAGFDFSCPEGPEGAKPAIAAILKLLKDAQPARRVSPQPGASCAHPAIPSSSPHPRGVNASQEVPAPTHFPT
jgi:hypothetical protein